MMKLRSLLLLIAALPFLLQVLHAQPLKSDTIDVINYTIRLDMRHLSHMQLYGATEITAVPRMAAISSFSLDFRKLTVDSVLLNGIPHPNYTYNDTVIRILLSAPLTQGDTFMLRVVYHGIPLIEPYNWGGFHFLPDSTLAYNLGVAFDDYPHNYGRIWFPCLDDFIDRATYDLHVRTKGTHKAVGGGVLADTILHPDGTITWHWKLDRPIPTYLASVAAGELVKIEGAYLGIQDTIPTLIFVRPQDSLKAVSSFANLNNMMAIFESRFGPYRWPRVGYTGTTKGAMEHATNIAMPRNLITGNLSYDWLIAHELSHHWFGNMVTCASAEDMWINEGWARYCEAIYAEGMYGWETYKITLMDLQKQVINFAHTNASGGDGAWFPLYPVPQTHTYGTTVYDKGGLIAHTLRGYLGDSIFFDAIRALLDHFAFQPMSSHQMRNFLTTHTGINMAPFFDGWVFTPGFPHFSVDSFTSQPQGNGWDVTVYVKQKMFGRTVFTDLNNVEIGLYENKNRRELRRVQFSGATGQQTFWLPFEPQMVLMDPEERLSDAITSATSYLHQTGLYNYSNTFFRLKVNTLTDTMLFRIEHSFAPPDPLPQPITGLKLSPNRYWKVSGFFPAGSHLEGQFSYSTANQFDNALITSSADSLVILFRAGAGSVWQGIPFTKTSAPFAGTVTVPNLLPGEYVLAMWDKDHIGTNSLLQTAGSHIQIFPNPTSDRVTIRSNLHDHLLCRISNLSGELVYQGSCVGGRDCHADLSKLPSGIYVMEVRDSGERILTVEKITLTR